jgi:hypothetical protein
MAELIRMANLYANVVLIDRTRISYANVFE